jgi:catechol 2,3-dioxygenase-like lactoylglutathione lyase family enzyme
MMMKSRFAELGEINQIAFIPEDFDACLKFWTEVMGAGPFFVLAGTIATSSSYLGAPTNPVLDIALGHLGDIQIEIIRQTNDAPSPYKAWRDAGGAGVHHTCIAVPDIAAAKTLAAERGMEILLTGAANGAEWIYVDTGGGPGTIVEIIQHSAASQGLMDMVRAAARGWDGGDPVRRLTL